MSHFVWNKLPCLLLARHLLQFVTYTLSPFLFFALRIVLEGRRQHSKNGAKLHNIGPSHSVLIRKVGVVQLCGVLGVHHDEPQLLLLHKAIGENWRQPARGELSLGAVSDVWRDECPHDAESLGAQGGLTLCPFLELIFNLKKQKRIGVLEVMLGKRSVISASTQRAPL